MTTNLTVIPTNLPAILVDNERPADQNAALVYLASLQPSGRRSQAQVLRTITRWLGGEGFESIAWGSLRYQHTAAIRTMAVEQFAPATARKFAAALCGVLKHAWRLGQIGGEDYQRAIDIDPIQGQSIPPGRYIEAAETDKMIQACRLDLTPLGIRDAAIIGLMYTGSLRRDEVSQITMEDYNSVDNSIIIHGKRKKNRKAFVHGGALNALRDWLALRGTAEGFLFAVCGRSGRIHGLDTPLSSQSIYNLVKRRAHEAGIPPISPHDFRRTGISDLLDKNVDVIMVSRIAGHSSPNTTAKYDRRPEQKQMDASALLDVPYQKQIYE